MRLGVSTFEPIGVPGSSTALCPHVRKTLVPEYSNPVPEYLLNPRVPEYLGSCARILTQTPCARILSIVCPKDMCVRILRPLCPNTETPCARIHIPQTDNGNRKCARIHWKEKNQEENYSGTHSDTDSGAPSGATLGTAWKFFGRNIGPSFLQK